MGEKILIFPHLLFVLICFVLFEINFTFAADSRVNGKFTSPLNSIPSVENERKGHLSTGVINSALYPENVRGFQPRRFNDVSVLSQPTLAPTAIIATPYIISATLSSDGRYASIVFDTSTNKGGSSSSSFTCSSILDFTGDDVATCLWLDSLTIAIYPDLSTSTNIANALNVGSVIRLLSSNSIYSVLCDITNLNSACSQAVQQTVFVLGPSDPVSPYVSVAISKTVSSCSPLTVDFTGCTGDGQRGWQSISVTVTANNASAKPSALATYIKSQFSTKVPISVPTTYLTAETTYNVTVKLCNIFVDCATGFAQFSVTSGSSSAPVVSLTGLSSTTFYASSTVSVTAPAYVVGCGGTTTSVGLVYTWKVLVGTTAVSVSEVIRGNSLTIPAYALQTGQTYTIQVTVRNKWSDLKTTVSGSFTVQVSALVASLSPSTMQLLRAGKSLTFSASGSYDPDDLYNDNGALSYTWTCAGYTLNGKAHPSCLLTLSGSTGSSLTVSATTAAINSTSTLTLRVSKDTRNTTVSVKVEVIEGSAPLITMQTGTSSVTAINTANALLISGLVQSDYDVSCVWSATPTSLSLDTASLTSYKKSVTASTPTLANLYLAGNSLAVRSTYVFTLTCLRSAASITVTTNGPPVGGTYSISPTSGIEMSQLFTTSTSQWSDTELPITYLFGFISPSTGLVSTIQSRSSVAYASATLPGGRSTNAYLVNTIVLAFDSLNSSAQLNQTVTVTTLPAADVASTIVSKLNATKGSTNLNDLKAVISVVSSVISRVSCDSAPNCASLNRSSCSTTADTCGACLDGFVGQQGDSNTLCISSGSSSAPQQQCVPSDCSSHGSCKFFDRTSGLETSSCSILSSTCFPQCVCSEGYYGTTCAFTSAELQDQQSLRSDLLASLSYVASNEDTTAESVSNLVSSISGIIQTANDVNIDSVTTFSTIAQTTLSNAVSDTTITADSLAGLLGPTDAAIAAQSSATGNNSALAVGNSIISAYAAIVSRDAAAGLPATTLVYDNFRFAQQTVDPADTVTLQVPQTGAESSTSSSVSSISLVSSGSNQNESSVSLQVVQYNSNLLSVNNSKYSGILQAQFSTSGDHTVLLTLTNTAGKIGPKRTDTTPLNYTTSCTTGDYGTYTYTCPVSEEQIVHKCHGIKGNLMTYCPVLATVCSSVELSNATVGLNLDGYTCSVSNMTAQFITCKCYPDDTDSRRRLSVTSSLQGTGVLTAVAMAQYTAFEVGETFKAAPDLTSPEAISRALIVIAMFTVLWAGGLILISGCFIRQRQLHQENLERKLDDAGKTQKNSENSSVEEIRERLTKYVDSVFPVIFYPGHLLLRLKDEIRRNHKYLMMFMLLEGELEGKKRFINGIQLLTIQSALMFLLALLYDIQSPSDDGSCPGYTGEDDCLKRKSVFDSSRSYCDWTDSPATGTTNCTFNNAEVSFQATIYIQVIVSVASALIMRPLTYLFDVLLAPNVDNIKAKLAEEAALKSIENVGANRQSMVGRMTRRVGRVANSVASMIKFAQPKQVDPKELENMPVTLIPDEVEMVHTQARAYFRKLTQRAAAYEEKASTNPEHGHKSLRFTMMKRIQTTYAEYMGKVETEHVDAAEKKWEELKGLIKEQRGLLKPEELAEYDDQWGLDPATGEFLVASATDKKLKDVEKIIQKELAIVERTSQDTIERLHLAVDSHVGLEILHKFILDILGRDTPAGCIFANKTEEDFRRSSVQTRRAKIFAIVCIVAANALFVYYSILRGYVKGVDWQKSYLIACLVQMMLEIYLFETIECLWINVFIPSLVSSEVQRVNNLLLNIINDLCNKAIMGQKLLDESKAYSLDVTKFLFTSNRIASVHPTLMESMMVRSYHTHLPGELSRKWSASGETKVTTGFFAVRNRRENVSFPIAMIGSVILTLQIAAMTPFDVQKMFLRFIQPFLYGGLVLFGKSIISNPIYIAITVAVIAILAGLLMYQYWKSEAENDEARMSKVQPISPVPIAEEAKPFDSAAGDLAKKKEMEYLKAQRESLRQKASAWAVSESKSHSSDSESTHGGKEYNIRTAETARRINSGNKNTLKASVSARKAPVIATASSVSQDGKDDKAVYHQWESSEEKSEMGGESYMFSSSENPTSKLQTTLKDDDEDDLGQLHKPKVTPAKAKAKSMTTGSSAAHSIDMESFTSQSLDDSFHPVK